MDGETLKDQIVEAANQPSSSTIEGNTVTNRPLSELVAAQQSVEAREQAKKANSGVRRMVHRHQGPSGGPTQ